MGEAACRALSTARSMAKHSTPTMQRKIPIARKNERHIVSAPPACQRIGTPIYIHGILSCKSDAFRRGVTIFALLWLQGAIVGRRRTAITVDFTVNVPPFTSLF
jgi:hypothetical protein